MGGARLQFLDELELLLFYENWIQLAILGAINDEENEEEEAIQLSIAYIMETIVYVPMCVYGNDIHVKSAETNLVTMNF